MEIKEIVQVVKNIVDKFFELETHIRLSDGKNYYMPEERMRRLFIHHKNHLYQVKEVGYVSEHLQAKIDAFFEDIAQTMEDSKSFYKKMKKYTTLYKEKQTPKSAYNVLNALGTLQVSKVTSTSGSFEFCDKYMVTGFFNPESLKVNKEKRELKQINKEIRSLYADIEQLKKRKEELLNK